MRALIVIAGAALGLAACGDDEGTANSATADESLTAENIVANDVTAIDAVTADAANMAADVDINFTNEFGPVTGNMVSGAPRAAKSRPSGTKGAPAPRRSAPEPDEPANEPAADPAGNATE